MLKITLESVISINDSRYIGSKIGEELMLMDLNTGNYININQIGTIIWEQIQEPKKVEDICKVLQKDFDVTEEQCQKDTLDYLQRMGEQDLINIG
jgi:hypothetical protein